MDPPDMPLKICSESHSVNMWILCLARNRARLAESEIDVPRQNGCRRCLRYACHERCSTLPPRRHLFVCLACPSVEVSKLAELNDSAGGYDWAWQNEAKALREKAEAADGLDLEGEDRDAKAALKLSMDNILMVRAHLTRRYY